MCQGINRGGERECHQNYQGWLEFLVSSFSVGEHNFPFLCFVLGRGAQKAGTEYCASNLELLDMESSYGSEVSLSRIYWKGPYTFVGIKPAVFSRFG